MAINKIYAIILAGGASSRMGRWKGALPWGKGGRPIISAHEKALLALGAEYVVSIVPADQESNARNLLSSEVLIQPDSTMPLTSSLQLGLRHLNRLIANEHATEEPATRYLLMNPVDMAPLSEEPLKSLWKVARKSKAIVTRPVVFGADLDDEDEKLHNGHPVIIHESLWPVILKADVNQERIDQILRDIPMDKQRGVDLNEHVHPWLLTRSMNTPEEFEELSGLAHR